jgi:hypothetical protein
MIPKPRSDSLPSIAPLIASDSDLDHEFQRRGSQEIAGTSD